MKQKFAWIVLSLAAAMQFAWADSEAVRPLALKPVVQEAQAAHLASEVLSRYAYKALPLDDSLSGKIFDQYLKALDPQKIYFLQGDIDRLAPGRTVLDDAIRTENLNVPFAMFDLYLKRATEHLAYARTLLQKGFDFQRDESYEIDRAAEPWPATEAEMRELWRKRVKNDWLRLKLAGSDKPAIVRILDRRYDNALRRLREVASADAFQMFMNAYTMAIDPHSNYLGPRQAEDFGIAMRLSLVGIGAVLTEVDEFTTIRELVPGGPAMASGQLKVGDRIVGVAQGENGAMEDVLGRRLDDIVALIRGAGDSTVRLDILPAQAGPDGPHRVVTLVRKTISLQDQQAQAKVFSVTDGSGVRRVGVITLPSFYEDFDGRQRGTKDYRSATRDVARLLADLKKKNVDGLLVDLRDNGGGSLNEAVELTGLFVGKGPVVQQRNAQGAVKVETSSTGVAWDGPMAVLINRASASASEIFAAAIQDYGRGVIVGAPSFGKGTVQTVTSLDRIARHDKPTYGELRMTIAQFFRVNGGTTQLRGVTPDIALPSFTSAADFGESSFDNALPWTSIKPADYTPVGSVKAQIPLLLASHESRVKQDKDFQDLTDDIALAEQMRKKNVVSLNEAERRKERQAQEKRLAERDGGAAAQGLRALQDDGLRMGERDLAKELAAEKTRKSAKDVLLNEAVAVVGDEVALKDKSFQSAAGRSPRDRATVKELPELTRSAQSVAN